MSGPEPVPPTRDQLLQEAATWFARMRGPEADASREEFEAWLRRGALHRQAYNRASEIFAMGKVLAEDAEAASNGQRPDRRRRSSSSIAWALVALLLLVGAGWFAFGGTGMDERKPPIADGTGALPPAQILSTMSGGPRTVRLADGSLVTLESDSLLEVRLGASERRLDLRRGSGRFQVFRETRPFVVHAGGGSVVARGTIFDVGYARDRSISVRLIEGSVDVSYPARANAGEVVTTTRRLQPGETVSYGAATEAGARSAPAGHRATQSVAEAVTAAPQPSRDFDNVTLGSLIEIANRGSALPIRLAGPALAERRVSGRFRIDDTTLLAERLAVLFDLALDRRPDGIMLRSR
jgi:transmembrane sensor